MHRVWIVCAYMSHRLSISYTETRTRADGCAKDIPGCVDSTHESARQTQTVLGSQYYDQVKNRQN
jgi:hypothetical protein